MKLRVYPLLLIALLTTSSAIAQGASPFPVTLEKELAARASNFTEVSLDQNMLAFACKFLDGKSADDEKVLQIVKGLNGIYVRSYEFEKEGQYTREDLEAIRSQFATPAWSSLVRERSKDATDDTDIYVKLVNGDVHGMFILNAERKELTFVYISGSIRPEDLTELGGNFGIPRIDAGKLPDGKAKGKGEPR